MPVEVEHFLSSGRGANDSMAFNEWPEPVIGSESCANPSVAEPSATTVSDGKPVAPIVQAFIQASEHLSGAEAQAAGGVASTAECVVEKRSARGPPKPTAAPVYRIDSEDLIQLDDLSDEYFPSGAEEADAGEEDDILQEVLKIEAAYSSSNCLPPGSVQEGGQVAVPAIFGTEGPCSMDRAAAGLAPGLSLEQQNHFGVWYGAPCSAGPSRPLQASGENSAVHEHCALHPAGAGSQPAASSGGGPSCPSSSPCAAAETTTNLPSSAAGDPLDAWAASLRQQGRKLPWDVTEDEALSKRPATLDAKSACAAANDVLMGRPPFCSPDIGPIATARPSALRRASTPVGKASGKSRKPPGPSSACAPVQRNLGPDLAAALHSTPARSAADGPYTHGSAEKTVAPGRAHAQWPTPLASPHTSDACDKGAGKSAKVGVDGRGLRDSAAVSGTSAWDVFFNGLADKSDSSAESKGKGKGPPAVPAPGAALGPTAAPPQAQNLSSGSVSVGQALRQQPAPTGPPTTLGPSALQAPGSASGGQVSVKQPAPSGPPTSVSSAAASQVAVKQPASSCPPTAFAPSATAIPFSAPPPRNDAAIFGSPASVTGNIAGGPAQLASLGSSASAQQHLAQANQAVIDSEQGGDAAKLAPAFQNSMDGLLAEWKAHSESIVQSSQSSVQQHLNESLHSLMRKADQNTQRQFQQQQSQISATDQRVIGLEGAMQAMQIANQQLWSEMEVVKKAAAVVSHSPQLNLDEDERWEAQPDLGIVKGHCAQSISLQAFASAVAPWLQRCQMQPGVDFEFGGDSSVVQTDWIIIFSGLAGTAARKAQSCLKRLKISVGKYEEFWALSPVGNWIPLFISGDKNNKQVATEISSKRMKEVVQARITQGEVVTAARREGVVCLGQVPLCVIMPKSCGDTVLQWNEPLLVSAKLVKEDLVADFTEATNAALASGNGTRALRARLGAIEWRP